jgi:hypothetical protein
MLRTSVVTKDHADTPLRTGTCTCPVVVRIRQEPGHVVRPQWIEEIDENLVCEEVTESVDRAKDLVNI